MKRVGLFLLCALFLLVTSCGKKMQSAERVSDSAKAQISVEPVQGLSEDFMRGVDISMVAEIEKLGGAYYDENGKSADVFQILKKHGVNWVRLRLWNNPVNDYNVVEGGVTISKKGDPVGGGNNSIDVDIALAKRAKKAGLKILERHLHSKPVTYITLILSNHPVHYNKNQIHKCFGQMGKLIQ